MSFFVRWVEEGEGEDGTEGLRGVRVIEGVECGCGCWSEEWDRRSYVAIA